MKILAIDTSSKKISYSITENNNLIYEYNRIIDKGASSLVDNLAKKLKNLSFKIDGFDLFIVGAGPGSFTGLRISFSLIKAFSLVAKKPAFSKNSFFLCAYPFRKKKKKIAVVADARKKLIYAGFFESKNGRFRQISAPKLMRLKDCLIKKKEYLFITYDSYLRKEAQKLRKNIDFWPEDVYPRARYFAEGINNDKMIKESCEPENLKPLYLHPLNCQIKK